MTEKITEPAPPPNTIPLIDKPPTKPPLSPASPPRPMIDERPPKRRKR